MKLFQQKKIREVLAHADEGGQALHLMSGRFGYFRDDTPNYFKKQNIIAHLFDRDRERLTKTAPRLGVRVIKVERAGEAGQHVDLCRKPLARAINLALCSK